MPDEKLSINRIIDSYYQKILKLTLFHLKNKQESEEITQDVFLKVLKKISSFKGQSDIYTWIYRIAINTVINHIKRKNLVRFLSFEQIPENEESVQNLSNNDPALHLEKEESDRIKLKMLEDSIGLLSNRQRTAFYLFYYDNLSQKQIAAIMKTSVSGVQSLINKAKKKITRNLTGKKSTPLSE